jgi:hypothetical protein
VQRVVWQCLPVVEVRLTLSTGRQASRTFDMCEASGWSNGFVQIGASANVENLTSWAADLRTSGFEASVFETDSRGAEHYRVVLGPFFGDKVQAAKQGWLAAGGAHRALVISGKPFVAQRFPADAPCGKTTPESAGTGSRPVPLAPAPPSIPRPLAPPLRPKPHPAPKSGSKTTAPPPAMMMEAPY